MFFNETPSYNGSLSSTHSVVKTKFKTSPFSLIIKCRLNPQNQPIEHLPWLVTPSRVLWMRIRWLRYTRRGVLSTKLIPVHSSSIDFSCSASKNLQNSSAKQKILVTLSLEKMTVGVNLLIRHLKL